MKKAQNRGDSPDKLFDTLYNLIKTLRGRGGCPWDRKQTLNDIRMYVIEEAYEVLDSVEAGDMDELCDELGDLLFMVLFMVRVAEEKGSFTLNDVLERIKDKMIRRHTHVFGREKVESAEQVVENWKRIKEKEGKGGNRFAFNMPATIMIRRNSGEIKRALGITEEDKDKVVNIITEKIKLALEDSAFSEERLPSLIPELLILIVLLAKEIKLNAEDLIRSRTRELLSLNGI